MKEEESITQAPFRFKEFIIAESSIKIKPETKAGSVEVHIEPKGTIYNEKKLFEIHLIIALKSDDGLEVSIKMIGLFEFKEVVKEDNLSTYFYVNAPAIMFPYLRSYISALTALSGCKTIILPPMNMTSLGETLKEKTITK